DHAQSDGVGNKDRWVFKSIEKRHTPVAQAVKTFAARRRQKHPHEIFFVKPRISAIDIFEGFAFPVSGIDFGNV
ncbi:MAG: hypothetical protein VX228_04440, partial [Pseudomonadota bacterium]|nr:hypothetical protein [Pseudomonadota bacterium]